MATCSAALQEGFDEAVLLLGQAVSLASSGRFDEAGQASAQACQAHRRLAVLYCWRAAAHAAGGLVRLAVADYTQALQLDPGHAPAYTGRGNLFRQTGQLPEAIADFEAALRVNWEFSAASGPRATHESQPTIDPLAPVPSRSGSPVPSAPPRETTRQTAVALTPPKAPLVADRGAPMDRTGGPAPPCSGTRGRLKCPKCGPAGALDWNQPAKVFRCRRCRRSLRADAAGKLVPVPGSATAGPVRKGSPVPRRPRLFAFRSGRRALLAAALLGSLVLALCTVRAIGAGPLEARCNELAEAWLARDQGRLRALLEPGHEDELSRWLASNPPPDPGFLADPARPRPRVVVERTDGQTAQVTLRLAARDDSGIPRFLVFYQRWVQQDGRWYFSPPAARTKRRPVNPRQAGGS